MNEFYSRKKGESPAQKNLEKSGAALGVALSHRAGHVSLIYTDYGDDGTSPKLTQLHFLSNKIKADELSLDPKEKGHFFYAEAACVAPSNLVGFNAYLMAVSRNEAELRYGVDWSDDIGLFDGHGNFIPPENSYGLTCASFLSEVFYGFSMKLFDMTTWPRDAAHDVDWRNELFTQRLEAVRRGEGQLSEEQILEILDTSPLVRLHPAQVGAAIASDRPKEEPGVWKYPEAKELADQLIADFNRATAP